MSPSEGTAMVADPRPRSAWVLALVASASLWITQQLAGWVIAVQLVVMLYTFVRRLDPRPIQRSALMLNFCMMGISGTTIALALKGNPSTISLAHFAALSQCLQLLDARPRRTEFLFVTLALFQVILAANLTDSVFFPALLLAFLVSATWTLMVHTLRTEALETREVSGVETREISALVRMTAVASVASLLVALVLFVTLPRFRTGVLKTGLNTQTAISGFSDRVELGEFGSIRKDHSIVLRVETLQGTPPEGLVGYWRGLAFDAFDGRSWSITPVSDLRQRQVVSPSPRYGSELNGGPGESILVQRIVREPVEAGVLFGAGIPRRLEAPFDRLEIDTNGAISNPHQPDDRIRYTVWTDAREWSDVELRKDEVALPPDRTQPPIDGGRRYLALPDFDPRIRALALEITAPARRDADRARRIEAYLRSQGSYTDTPPPMGGDPDRSPVEEFLLGELAGHCEYFASGMVVLARYADLPARLVNGFAGGRRNDLGGFVELTSADAHAWVEIHYEDAGWVRYDPTPPDLRMRALGELGFVERLAAVGSVLEIWWFQRVVDFDSSDQFMAFKAAWQSWDLLRAWPARKFAGALTSDARREAGWQVEGLLGVPNHVAIAAAAGMVAIGFALLRLRRLRSRAPAIPEAYTQALRLLRRRGLVRSPSTTARDFCEIARSTLSPAAATSFRELTDAYLAERFGDIPHSSSADCFERFRLALRQSAPISA